VRRHFTDPLFPYTTLFRSVWAICHFRTSMFLRKSGRCIGLHTYGGGRAFPCEVPHGGCTPRSTRCAGRKIRAATCCYPSYYAGRSEEHTSELQSLAYLVCR